MLKKKILISGVLPPPYNGPTITYDALMSSSFPSYFDIIFVKANMYDSVNEVGVLSLKKIIYVIKYSVIMFKKILLNKPDFILITASFNNFAFLKNCFFLLAAWIKNIKIVQYAHDDSLRIYYKESSRIIKWLIRKYMDKSFAWIVLGNSLKNNFYPFFPQEKILVVESGIKITIDKNEAKTIVKNRNVKIFRVLYLGNLIESKGFFDLVKSVPLLLKKFSDFEVVIAGAWDKSGFQLKNKVMKFINDNKIEKHVSLIGRIVGNQKKNILLSSDILVFPTRYEIETFGLVNLEAMEVGLPVISTARGAIPEIIEDKVNGLIIPENDSAKIAEAITILKNNLMLRREMGLRNIEKFHNMYTYEKYGTRMARAFHDLASN